MVVAAELLTIAILASIEYYYDCYYYFQFYQ